MHNAKEARPIVCAYITQHPVISSCPHRIANVQAGREGAASLNGRKTTMYHLKEVVVLIRSNGFEESVQIKKMKIKERKREVKLE